MTSGYSESTLAGLRDFQRDTAVYAFDRIFGGGEESTSRFLVADEVGLGKTLVARGVIAQAIDYLRASGDRRIDIVYVASNSAIAGQNVRKLAPDGVVTDRRTDRLSLLPFRLGDLGKRDVNVIALTPVTSLDLRSSGGTLPERAAVLAALRSIWSGHRLRGSGIARIFAGDIGPARGLSVEERIREDAAAYGYLEPRVARLFEKAMAAVNEKRAGEGLADVDSELHDLAPTYAYGRPTRDQRSRRNRLIRELREAMSWTGVQLLQPDLVILDEFQRFKALLDDSSEESITAIARALFTYEHRRFSRTARVLLLSATPYLMHTTTAEVASGSDAHFDDFIATYRFLAAGLPRSDPGREEALLRERLSRVRTTILDAEATGVEPVREAMEDVREQLSRVMVRTERLASTPDHDGMLVEVPVDVGAPSVSSLRQYVDTAAVARHLRSTNSITSADVMEYWKSSPYTLSFLSSHGYQLTRAVLDRIGAGRPDAELLDMMRRSSAMLPWSAMRRYGELDPANGRLSAVWADMFGAGAHRLLWLPPSAPYYRAVGRFDTSEARRLTKRLVFSSWALVPTVVSTLTSYECERRLHQEARGRRARVTAYDTEASSRHTRHLRFVAGDQATTAMVFVLPSPAMAMLCDPLAMGVSTASPEGLPELDEVRLEARRRISAALEPCLPAERGAGAGSSAWYTLAPMLLDALAANETGYDPEWVQLTEQRSAQLGTGRSDALLRLQELLTTALDAMFPSGDRDAAPLRLSGEGLPSIPSDLEEVLAVATLAGPPTVLYRALSRHFPDAQVSDLVDASWLAAQGLFSLFNSWEATRIIDASDLPGTYWRKALEYCAEGHLQSVTDEYVAALVEWRGHNREADRAKALRETAKDVAAAATLQTSTYDVYGPTATGLETQSLRGRFAVRFGDGRAEDKSEQRAEAVTLAFNSPFWPFVLTTTSVGQEGLDFHLYCHAVTHWNLPTNPVDLEQREGRVHRYKGHAVRKNVGRAVGPPSGTTEPWAELFERAVDGSRSTRESEIVPFWVFEPTWLPHESLSRIERHLVVTPYSREASRLGPLLASVAYYRLAFGQPRQEELLRHVLHTITDEGLRRELATVRVDLSPPRGGATLDRES